VHKFECVPRPRDSLNVVRINGGYLKVVLRFARKMFSSIKSIINKLVKE